MWLMAGCGLRIGEASAVTLQQFDFEVGVLYVDRQVTQDGENEKPNTARQAAITKGRGRAHCVRHLKRRDMDEGRAVPLPAYIAAKVKGHVRLYGAFRVEERPNRLKGDCVFSNVGRTSLLMYSLSTVSGVAPGKQPASQEEHAALAAALLRLCRSVEGCAGVGHGGVAGAPRSAHHLGDVRAHHAGRT
ncbi:hypothetical protein ABZ135_20020 [Streptomyces sp. NPDC006339]|uniref:hypothetical protein n=1 Tax=Streptomyces sp. NPDC006339 TaxID=3156755 RepID=UPI0033B8CEAA